MTEGNKTNLRMSEKTLNWTLAEAFCNWLKQSEELAAQVGSYNGGPAIFAGRVPAREDEKWQVPYPYIFIRPWEEMRRKRVSQGFLCCSIRYADNCENSGKFCDTIRNMANGLILSRNELPPVILFWSRSHPYVVPDIQNQTELGEELALEIYELPRQTAASMDPVTAVGNYIKKEIPDTCLAGLDVINGSLKPVESSPVYYLTNDHTEAEKLTNDVVWTKSRLRIYALHGDREVQINWLMKLYENMAFSDQADMEDSSQLTILQIIMETNERLPYEPHLTITIRYGLKKEEEQSEPMNNIHTYR